MPLQTVHTDHAPAAIGPYSQGVIANGFLFTAGQIALDPATTQVIDTTAKTNVTYVYIALAESLDGRRSNIGVAPAFLKK